MATTFKERYAAYDALAKNTVIAYLAKKGWHCAAPEMYAKADITAIKDGEITYHEVEIKKVWKDGDNWPEDWATITIPYRKSKLFLTGEHLGCKRYCTHDRKLLWFWVISHDLRAAWSIPATKLRAIEEKYVNSSGFRGMDKFYKVSLKSAKLITLA